MTSFTDMFFSVVIGLSEALNLEVYRMVHNFQEPSASGPVNPFKLETSRRQVLAVGGISLGALLLAACTNSPSSGTEQSGGTPKKGGTLRISIGDGSSSDTLDPGTALTANASLVVKTIYDPLAVTDNNFQVQPALATSWEVNSDATQWTIHLREGVKWHDGSDFTSKDVLYTISRWLDPKTGSAINGFLSPYLDMGGVSAPDASTVVLNLKKPNSVLIQTLGANPASQMIKDGVTDFSGKNLVGTGPFKLTAWSPGTGWKAVRNDAYWGDAVYLDGIEASITPDQGAKLQAALSGAADITDLIPVSLWAGVQGRNDLVLETIKNRQSWVFAFDQRVAPFDDHRVLDAIKLATDRDKMVETALLGQGTATADVPIAPGSSWYPSGLKPEYDQGKAKALLAEAGFPNGLDMKLSVTDSVPGMLDAAQAWQQAVKSAGINVTLDQFSPDTYWSKGYMATPAFMSFFTQFFPPVGFDAFYRKSAAWPYTHFADPAVDKIVDELYATTDQSRQVELTQEAYLQARKSFGLLIPVFSDAAYARSSKVNGVFMNLDTVDFRKTWLA
ncbi:ABC transporter substrate-binding protein [Arthrobacter sp. ISL-30]|uniref:ABC transporter substrate-binding protein n=1 Tax=Arthrobacter sp. ISL-30 TaxID=2819109 RepID=UPI001BE5380E|nr:ABC transporter substrate-binding protein [Arthrobacter sp. ISL-30]MBT2514740.1 ABC transporter substrate-binding protein [Arthrobacter sp. ISL-30]